MAKRISPDVERALVQGYRTNPEGGRTLARQYGVGGTTLYRVLRRNGIRIDPRKARQSQHHRHFKFPSALYARIVAQYEQGVSSGLIAQQEGCSRWVVLAAMRRAGRLVRNRGMQNRLWPDRDVERIANLALAGWSQERIARRFKTHQTTVSRILQRCGLETRRRAERHGSWKGGRIRTSYGYVAVRVAPDSPFAVMAMRGGYIMEHRLVVAQSLGRPLRREESVHHRDGVRTHNTLANLQLLQRKHVAGTVLICADCGSRNVIPQDIVA